MKSQIVIPVILGLHNALFIVHAQKGCEAGKNVWNNTEVELTNPQDLNNQTYTEMKVSLRSKGNYRRRFILIPPKHEVPIICYF